MRKCLLAVLLTAALLLSASLHHTAAAQDVYKVAPTMYKLLSDTLGIRMLEATYKPGDSSLMHVHPDFALYVLEGGQVAVTGKNGNRQVVDFKAGMGVVLPTDTHTAKNIGNTTVRLVVVEVSRPRSQ
jgi:quercetin dioxygenase-like cupin family protein